MYWMHFAKEFYRPTIRKPAARVVPSSLITAFTVHYSPTAIQNAAITQVSTDCLAQMEERIKELEAELTLSKRSREAFLSSMSHELRTPLNAIMGFSGIMKDELLGAVEHPTYHEYAGHIHDSGSALLGKINDLLDIASIDVGGLALQEEDFALQDLLNEAVEIHSHAAFSRNQQLKIDCASNIRIFADRRKLLCALTHFLANAVRHSKQGAEICLMARIQPDDGVIISVRDEGEGIHPNQLNAIRDAFQKNAAYKNIEAGGIGLGLSLAKELATQHEGRMMIDSIRHRGTVVSLILPKERILAGMPAKRRRSL